MRASRAVACLVLGCVAGARGDTLRAQDSAAANGPAAHLGDEGALDNDAFLPFNTEASAQLALGDAAYAKLAPRLRENAASIEDRAWTDVFEGWRAALANSHTGDIVPPRPRATDASALSAWPDPDGTASQTSERRGDGVEYAVLRRLSALDARARKLWEARFGALAERELAAAPNDPVLLARVEREFPATSAATAAAIALCEFEFERAQFDFADAWLARARRHAALLGDASSTLAAAVERRAQLLTEVAAAKPVEPAWAHATSLKLSEARLVDTNQLGAGGALLEPGIGLRPGLAFLDDRRIALQSLFLRSDSFNAVAEDLVTLIEINHARPTAPPFRPKDLLPDTWQCGGLRRPTQAPGWPLLPAARGDLLVLVNGRQSADQGNALMCITVDVSEHLDPPRLPRLRWAVHDGARCDADGHVAPLSGLHQARVEFQPGPLLVGSTIYAIAREFLRSTVDNSSSLEFAPTAADEIRSWLCAFDLETGDLRWQCDLGKGSEVQRDRGRFMPGAAGTASAQAPLLCGSLVFAGTHTGLGSLVEAVDGRVAWTLKNRRRDPEQRTWTGAQPAFDESSSCVVWAPADSDRVYWLRAAPDLDGRGLMLHPPRAIGDGEVLIGGDSREALVLEHANSQRTLNAWSAAGGGVQSPELGPAEKFFGEGLCSSERALFATNRSLYLFDRGRELYLLDNATLAVDQPVITRLGKPGGSIWARGEHVCVLGLSTLWIFTAH